MSWYSEYRNEWKEIIETVARECKRAELMVETDTVQSMFLLELSKINLPFVFKGGTSLSKAYNRIDRFSEDIDLSMNRKPTQTERKASKEHIVEIAKSLGMELTNPDQIKSRHDYNMYVFSYDSLFASKPMEIIVETSYYQTVYPVEKHEVGSFVGKFCKNNGISLPIPFEAATVIMNVQSLERKEMSDDEAIIKMVDANIQREEILPSERAFSFKMKMDAIKRQGARDDLTSGTEFQKSGIKVDSWSKEVVGDEAGMTGRQVAKYIRLTELIPELLDNVDVKKITLTMGVDLSYLDVQVQKWVYEYFKENGFLKPVQVEALKNHSNLSNASQHMIITILNEALPKKSTAARVSLSEKKLDKYFPPHYSAKDRENVIIQLLEQWSTQQAQE